jgi:signal transduction histidine kinase
MPNGGDLVLETSLSGKGETVEVLVRDTGEGMTPDQLERAFIPFHTTKKSGMGIGLPLVRRVIERCGGSVSIDSAPGAGTSVRLQLPARV